MSFGNNIGKILSNKYGQNLLDSAKKSTTNAIKTASRKKPKNYWWIKISTRKRCIFLKIIDELRLAVKERYISPEKSQQIIDELRLVWQYNNNGISKIENLLDKTSNQPSKFRTKNWVEINFESRGTC